MVVSQIDQPSRVPLVVSPVKSQPASMKVDLVFPGGGGQAGGGGKAGGCIIGWITRSGMMRIFYAILIL